MRVSEGLALRGILAGFGEICARCSGGFRTNYRCCSGEVLGGYR